MTPCEEIGFVAAVILELWSACGLVVECVLAGYLPPPSLPSHSLTHSHVTVLLFNMQLFRADLISAMKLPDSVPMETGSFLTIRDPWRTEWEIGVQVSLHFHCLPSLTICEHTPHAHFSNLVSQIRLYLPQLHSFIGWSTHLYCKR